MRRAPVDDAGLWHWAVRNVAPLPGRKPPPAVDRSRTGRDAPDNRVPAAAPIPATPSLPPAPLPPLDRFAGVDRATAERLRRGRYPVSGRLDLHGLTQAEAHRALSHFVAASRAAGRRCLLVITGHGRTTGGILKAAAPRWLAEPELRPHVLAIAPAQPQDGGAGALYVLLRRPPI